MTRTIGVELPSGTLYVSGTVNGAAVTWTNTEGNTWQAIADRAEDDVYRVELTLIGAAGSATTASLTLYYGLHLITDRTLGDVSRVSYLAGLWVDGEWTGTAAELAEWSSDLKGAYNASDLNRVGAAMLYVAKRYEGCGYAVGIGPKTDWLEDDIPVRSQMEHYLANLSALRGLVSVMTTTPSVPEDMEGLTHVEANNIEKILEDLDVLLTRSMLAWYYSGELYAGEV
nr:MAG TPA: hypothetical protein [Caudoviricetes sp.]